MTDVKKIIDGAKAIEKILTEQFGGTGRGMTEKLNSSRYPIPEPLQKRIKHLAWLRNRSVHEDGFELEDPDDYAAKCARVCEELKRAHAVALTVEAARAERSRSRSRVARGMFVAVAGLAAAWWLVGRGAGDTAIGEPDRPAVQQETVAAEPAPADVPATPAQASAPAPAAGAVGQAGPASGAREPAGRPRQEPAAQPAAEPAAQAEGMGTGHIGLGTDAVAIESVDFSFAKGAWGDPEPKIELTVRNTSDRVLSSLALDARLYVDGQAAPAIDTTGSSNRIYMFFGDRGLAPGKQVRDRLHISWGRDWNMPDVLNAQTRTLHLRVTEVSDGRKQRFGGSAAPWPRASGKAAPQPRLSARAPAAAALSQRMAAGEHVAVGGAAFELDAVKLELGKDAWGRSQPRIRVSIANRTGVTVSAVTFQAKLYIKGEKSPVVDTAGRDLYAFFHDQGLGDGQQASVDVSTSNGNGWDTPDVVNAIEAGQAQLVLRATSYSDGRKQRHPIETPRL